MNKPNHKYKHILFDLDRTLWDHDTNSRTSLEQIYHNHNLINITSLDNFIGAYNLHNNRLWAEYSAGRIRKSELRKMRFYLTLKQFKIKDYDLAQILDTDYVDICPRQTALFPHAIQLLEVLRTHGYNMCIVTNGFPETQCVKLKSCGIDIFFEKVYDSETIGYAKPSSGIFRHVLQELNAQPSECLMIGDDWGADIMGAAQVGIDQVYFNPKKTPLIGKPSYHVSNLLEIESLLI